MKFMEMEQQMAREKEEMNKKLALIEKEKREQDQKMSQMSDKYHAQSKAKRELSDTLMEKISQINASKSEENKKLRKEIDNI